MQGELEHRRVKRFYSRTNKNNVGSQIAKHERRERLLRAISRRREGSADNLSAPEPEASRVSLNFDVSEALPPTPPSQHHHISEERKHHLNIPTWLKENEGDLAVQVRVNNKAVNAY